MTTIADPALEELRQKLTTVYKVPADRIDAEVIRVLQAFWNLMRERIMLERVSRITLECLGLPPQRIDQCIAEALARAKTKADLH